MNDITDSDGEIGEEFSASLTVRSSIMLIVNGAEKQVEMGYDNDSFILQP